MQITITVLAPPLPLCVDKTRGLSLIVLHCWVHMINAAAYGKAISLASMQKHKELHDHLYGPSSPLSWMRKLKLHLQYNCGHYSCGR